ncbi:hypothetical protein [Mycobacterium sp. 3-98]|uniref:hypothetical protein n=1 Tax=Mycobacterium sp. 3-98 TaxID=3042317 RepID=UPI002DDB0EF3|nr:hypothetical protein [Mycobacterium sp. 3-98]WSE45590.1 hypothetical protein QGN30_21135 [Mycobacterium sp. 3-98]
MKPQPTIPKALTAIDTAIKAALGVVANADPGFTDPATISVLKRLAGAAETIGELLAEVEQKQP